MLGRCGLLLAAALVSPSYAVPPPAGHVLHERREPSHNWARGSRIDPSSILPVRIGLSQTNLDKGYDLLMDVSHPDSPKYGQWWTAEEVHDFFAPSAEAVDLVKSWIMSVGIADSRIVHHDNKGWLAVDATAEEAELLFKTTFHEYQHNKDSEALRIGADSYHIPEHLARHIDYVTPGAKLIPVQKRDTVQWRRRRSAVGPREPAPDPTENYVPHQLDGSLKDCFDGLTVDCVRAMYKIPSNPEPVTGNELGVYEMSDYFTKPDLDAYFANFASWVPQGTYPVPALIDGAEYCRNPGDSYIQGEANVGIGVPTAFIYPQKVILYQTDDPIYAPQVLARNGRYSFFNNFLDALDGSYCTYSAFGETGNDPDWDPSYPNPNPDGYQGKLMCGVYKPTKVISITFGQAEVLLPPNYMKRQCNEFMKLGLQGVSIVAATGDDGVSQPRGEATESGCLGPNADIFAPSYPITCPYVTAVGGTMFLDAKSIDDPEYTLNIFLDWQQRNFSSGGGFSNIFPIPDYQKAAVDTYLQNYSIPYPYYQEFNPDFSKVQGRFNIIGRAYPDVSAPGKWYDTFINGKRDKFAGTSVSAPVFASVLTLLNQERAKAGKDSIGFVNPVLYSHPEVLTDITHGTNYGCGTEGFPASHLWDPSTGLGTPHYPKMRNLWLALP